MQPFLRFSNIQFHTFLNRSNKNPRVLPLIYIIIIIIIIIKNNYVFLVNNHNFAAKGFPLKEKRENGNGDPMVDPEAE